MTAATYCLPNMVVRPVVDITLLCPGKGDDIHYGSVGVKCPHINPSPTGMEERS